MRKVLEFDKFLSEAKGDTIDVTVYDKTYKIKSRIPAIVPLMMARAEELADQSFRNAEYTRMIFKAADAIFGKDNMTEIAGKGMSVDELSLLIQKVFNLINGEEEDDDEEEELSDDSNVKPLPGKKAKK